MSIKAHLPTQTFRGCDPEPAGRMPALQSRTGLTVSLKTHSFEP
jgi:hypothetical protein